VQCFFTILNVALLKSSASIGFILLLVMKHHPIPPYTIDFQNFQWRISWRSSINWNSTQNNV